LKLTVPVAPVGTVAVRVTAPPYVDGFADDTSVVELAVATTFWVSTAEVLVV